MILAAHHNGSAETDDPTNLTETRERLAARRDQLVSRLQEALEATTSSNRRPYPPHRLSALAQAQATAFLDFLDSGSADAIKERGAECAEEGLGDQAILRLGTTLRQFCRDDLPDEALEAADVYADALLEGYIQRRETLVLKGPEQIRDEWQAYLADEEAQARAAYLYTRGQVQPAGDVWWPEMALAVNRRETIALADIPSTLTPALSLEGRGGGAAGESAPDAVTPAVSLEGRGSEAAAQSSPGRAALVVPLMLRGQVIGALDFFETDGQRRWSSDDIALVESVADQMVLAVENARAYAELQPALSWIFEARRRAPPGDGRLAGLPTEERAALGTAGEQELQRLLVQHTRVEVGEGGQRLLALSVEIGQQLFEPRDPQAVARADRRARLARDHAEVGEVAAGMIALAAQAEQLVGPQLELLDEEVSVRGVATRHVTRDQ